MRRLLGGVFNVTHFDQVRGYARPKTIRDIFKLNLSQNDFTSIKTN
ncbi:MAG: hypothetical protein K6T80_06315 [Firmicutes bacterium]|nr:hypothetical protein [Bacillota bacterium]